MVTRKLFRWVRLSLLGLAGVLAGMGSGPVVAGGGHASSAGWRTPEDLPDSALRRRIEGLPQPARERALAWLRRIDMPKEDVGSVNVDPEGGVYYEESFPLPTGTEELGPADPVTSEVAVPISPFPNHLKFHSRPGAPNVIYLNFAGENVSGTAWNDSLGRTTIPALAFSTDEDYGTFSDAEQLAIRQIWQRVAEDYAAFDIDVTTERPATFGTRTAHALITRNTDANGQNNPSYTSAGVAYVDVFGSISYARYRPAWIYFNQLAKSESYIAEAVSHELGHNFGLSHDGKTDGTEYYAGHGSGETSWGPIMGLGYNRNVSQWSKGEYYLANNSQDDLAILASKATYRADDVGNTFGTATALKVTDGNRVVATTPETDPANTNRVNKGIMERSSDVDVFSFVTGAGNVDLTVSPWVVPGAATRGGNLDLIAELYSEAGVLLLTANPATATAARIQTNLAEGVYYLRLRSGGAGDPLSASPTGYTAYASAGQYFINGTVTVYSGTVPPRAQLSVAEVTNPGAGAHTLTVTYTDNAEVLVSTIDGSDLRVLGPNQFSRLARLVSFSPTGNAPTVTATYALDPPNGNTWLPMDNGAYTVWMQTNQVGDTEGSWVAAGQLGQFTVDVPAVVYAANMDVNPNWTLEPLWHYGKPGAGETGPARGFTGENLVGYNLAGDYEPNLPFKYATTPAINCSGASALSLRFKRWLRTRNGDAAVIQISTNGVTWSDLWTSTRTVADNGWVDARYALPSWVDRTPALRIRWGISSGPALQDTGWNIDDVEIVAGTALETAPPAAVLAVDNVRTGGELPHALRVTYTDASGVRVTSLDSADLTVLGPNGTSHPVVFALVDLAADGTPRSATYHLPPPGGAWDAADNGIYQVVLMADEVSDVNGNTAPQTTLGSFAVDITPPPPMLLVEPTVIEVPEEGLAQVRVRLSQAPASDVTVTVARTGGDPDLFVQSGGQWVFSALNWSNAAVVTIGALKDEDREDGSATFECAAVGLAPVSFIAVERDLTPQTFTLIVAANEPAWGSTVPGGGTYPAGTEVSVQAVAAPYFEFSGWAGDVTSAANPLLLLVSSNLFVTAQFREILTTNHPTPLWWLASVGVESDFETAVDKPGANGMALWESYIAGLDPTNPEVQLRLSVSAVAGATEHVLAWQAVEGRLYSVEQSAGLDGPFTPLLQPTSWPAGTVRLTNSWPAGATAGFYRLQVQKAP